MPKTKGPITAGELARQVGAQIDGDASIEIHDASPIHTAGPGQITFVANVKYARFIPGTKASAIVLDESVPAATPAVIRHRNPYLTFARILDLLYAERPAADSGRHPSASISPSARLAEHVAVGPHVTIGEDSSIGDQTQIGASVAIGRQVSIGKDCRIYPNVSIMDGTIIGDRVIIHPGTVIGADGFGFAESETGLKKIQQVGWVEIGDDVEIGANCTIDRGALGPTRIGQGTKIDNLVMIAHNVEIGNHCIIVSQVGISGSTKLGNGVVLAGQVGIVGHIELGDGVRVGAQSGVSKSIPDGQTWFGYPARNIMETKRIEAALTRLPELFKRVRALESKGDK